MPGHLFYGPSWIVLGVNNICNLHCKMCDVGTKTNDTNFAVNLVGTKPLNMPEDLFFRIADQVKQYYPKTKLGYAFTEPLVYPHLESTLAYSSRLGLFTAITTNALNLRQKAEILAKNGLNELFISLDGPQDIHNEIRGHKSSFQWALEGIDKLLSLKKIPVSIFCVITEWNIGHLRQFAEDLRHLPIKTLGFMHSNFVTEESAAEHNLKFFNRYPATVSNVEEVNLAAFDLDLLQEELEGLQNGKFPFQLVLQPRLDDRAELDRYYRQPRLQVGKSCADAWNNIMIKSDGTVIPSHGRCFNLPVGNIYSQSLKEIWNAPKLAQLRKDLLQNGGLLPACHRCCSAVK